MKPWFFCHFCLAILQLGLYGVSGKKWFSLQSKRSLSRNHFPRLGKGSKQLVDASNASAICGLPLLTKGNRKRVVAGKKYKLAAKLTNNVNTVFDNVVLQFTLPRGANYRSARVFPRLDYGKEPALENQGTVVIWRDVYMKPKQSRYFKVLVDIACNTTTPLTFRVYTTVEGDGWIVGPDIQVDVVSSRSRKYVCEAFPAGPINITEYVTSLSDAPNPPNGVWTTGRGSILSTQNIVALPSSRRLPAVEGKSPSRALVASGYPFALRQETSAATISLATAGIFFDPHGICDGLLFRNFVLDGFEFYYEFWVDSTPLSFEQIYAPNLVLQTESPATGQFSSFVWDPYVNGDTNYQTWVTSSMNQNSGSDAPWPDGPPGGSGWGCTSGCFLPPNTTVNPGPTYRDLETYVQQLLSFGSCSSAFCAMTDAIITGIQVVLGPNEPNTVAFTRKVGFTAGSCSYEWIFGAD